MWYLTFSIVIVHALIAVVHASQDETGYLKNQIKQLRQDLAAQKAMNAELRTKLYESRFRRGMLLII